MNKCLITRLAAVVQDDTLRKIGELRVLVNKSTKGFVNLSPVLGTILTAETSGNLYFTDANDVNLGTVKTVSDNANFYVSSGNGYFSVTQKYDIVFIRTSEAGLGVELSDLKYSESLQQLYVGNLTSGTIEDLNVSNLSVFEIHKNQDAPEVYGNISAFKNSSVLTSFRCNFCHIDGNVAILGTCPKIETISIPGSKITGKIEDLVANLRASKGTSGSIKMPFLKSTGLTYQGIPVGANTNIPAGSNANTISWTESTITFT